MEKVFPKYEDIVHEFYYSALSPHCSLQRNFVESMAGYSLVCYLLQVNLLFSLEQLLKGDINTSWLSTFKTCSVMNIRTFVYFVSDMVQ